MVKEASRNKSAACVLAIGGLDPGGGAGILADSRAILHAGAFPCAAVSLLTVQSTSGVRSVTPVATKELVAECTEVLRAQNVTAIKVGALGSEENARAIGNLLAIHRDVPTVVDTVMLPTRGSGRLLDEKAITTLRDRILKRTTLVTVNAPEAEVLASQRVTRLDEAYVAARTILGFGPKAVLLKGGHLSGTQAIDLFVTEEEEIEIKSPRLKLTKPIHGGGCVLASLIAGRLAQGEAMLTAARWSKKAHHAALKNAANVGGEMRVLFAS